MTQPFGIGDAIASQVRKYRIHRNLSVRQLAEECARLGAPQLTAASLANIERGQDPDAKRAARRVLVEELAVLARALHVPPVLLVFPLGQREEIDVLPGKPVDTWAALKWWTGAQPFPGEEHCTSPEHHHEWNNGPLPLFDHHDQVVRSLQFARKRGEDEAAKAHAANLRALRKSLRVSGGSAPALPPELAHIDTEGEENVRG